jgi:hypothetical protein
MAHIANTRYRAPTSVVFAPFLMLVPTIPPRKSKRNSRICLLDLLVLAITYSKTTIVPTDMVLKLPPKVRSW